MIVSGRAFSRRYSRIEDDQLKRSVLVAQPCKAWNRLRAHFTDSDAIKGRNTMDAGISKNIGSIIALVLVAISAPALAQDYPNKPITMLVPQAPGASSDLLARTLGERLQAQWGQSVVIDNRPGAGGNVGAAIAARAVPDGYTLMIGTDAMMTSNVHLYKNMPFDPMKDFVPVAMAGANIICLAVHASRR